MSALNSKIICRTFYAESAAYNPGALKGGYSTQMCARSAHHLPQNIRTPFPAAPVRKSGEATLNTALYRHFGVDGSLLYVGISLSWPARTKQHAGGSRWFDLVAKVEIERFETREEALSAERDAIRLEKPQFNIIHNREAKPRQRVQQAVPCADPLFSVVRGPAAIVGPALIYRDDLYSVMIAHGAFDTPGELTEVQLGSVGPEMPEWSHLAASVISIRRASDLTMEEAKSARQEIIAKLRKHLADVEAFETDVAFAVGYAARFPSAKSRRVLDEVAVERESRQ